MTRILSSLPKSYNPLVTAWNLLPKDQQQLETLKLKLLEEEERLKDQHKSEEDTKAFAAWSSQTRSRLGQRNQWEITPSSSSSRNLPALLANPGRSTFMPGTGGRQTTPSTIPNAMPISGSFTRRGGSPYANSHNNSDGQPLLTY